MRGYPIYVKATYLLLFFFLFISALSYGKFVLTPIILGGLFAILLTPIGNRLEKWGAHRMFSSFICVLIMVLLVLTVAFFGFRQVASFGSDAPNLINTLNAKLNTAEAFIERKTHLTPDKQIDWVKSKLTESISAGGSFLSTLSSTTSTLAIILLIPLYTFFFMFYRNKMQVFFEKITPEDQHYKVHQILHRIQEVVQSYLSGIIIVIVILSFILSTGLLVIGVPYAIFLAVMAAFLNVIPYLGILTSALFAAFIALLTGHSASAPLFVLVLSVGANGEADWHSTIHKDQISVNDNGLYSSYLLSVLPDRLVYIYNDLSRKDWNLTMTQINSKGEVKNDILVRGAEIDGHLIPQYGDQVAYNELLIPCQDRRGQLLLRVNF
jgi:predicted PurR-regulated permease PerM